MSVSVTSECYKVRGGPPVIRLGEDLQLQDQGRNSSYKVRGRPPVTRLGEDLQLQGQGKTSS